MRFYLVAILSMGLVLLLTISKASTEDPEVKSSPNPETEVDAEGEAEGEPEGESESDPKAGIHFPN